MTTFNHQALAAAFEALGKPRLVPSPPSLSHQVTTVAGVIKQRRLSCYGALQITDKQIDEMARAIVAVLSLEAHSGGEP